MSKPQFCVRRDWSCWKPSRGIFARHCRRAHLEAAAPLRQALEYILQIIDFRRII
jgi:hypothetical protein